MKRYIIILVVLFTAMPSMLRAQHTFGVTAGYGSSSGAIYPSVESRSLYGLLNGGVSWRTYSEAPFVGCFGLDLQLIQRGFSISYATTTDEDEELFYYDREINTLMLPIVWQPHFYIAQRRVRVFFEAAATFSYDISSTFDNNYRRQLHVSNGIYLDNSRYEGEYEYMVARDNRFGYGLFGGGGVALIFGRFEFSGRVRYYYGLSDVVRNRNKYYSNNNDGYENPFYLTPIRSSLNGLSVSFGMAYRFGEFDGFKSWGTQRVKVDMGREFNFSTGEVNNKESNKRR